MHRNLKPDNLFLDQQGTVKIGDFTTTRMLDLPFQACTPEDPKERDRSGREMRRLWYRAPELILRDEIYGPKVDLWSVGCLLSEAATGKPMLPSDSEIDHLFRTFRLLGTPTTTTWPEITSLKNFSARFPIYPGFKFAQISRAASCGSHVDQDALLRQAQPDRGDILRNLFGAAAMLGPSGMHALDRMVTVPPSGRAGADAVLELPFFATPTENRQVIHPVTSVWLNGTSSAEETPPRRTRELRSRPDETPPPATEASHGSDAAVEYPPMSVSSTMITSEMVWSILEVMRQRERSLGSSSSSSASSSSSGTRSRKVAGAVQMPPGLEPGHRTVLMDFIVNLAGALSLTGYTLHLAARVVDKYLAQLSVAPDQEKLQVIGATCLKVADVFVEQSKEYYKQENADEYAEATSHQTSAEHCDSVKRRCCLLWILTSTCPLCTGLLSATLRTQDSQLLDPWAESRCSLATSPCSISTFCLFLLR